MILFCQSIGFFSNEEVIKSIEKFLKDKGTVIILDLIDNTIFNINRLFMNQIRKKKNIIYYALQDAHKFLRYNVQKNNVNDFESIYEKHLNILKKIPYASQKYNIHNYKIKNKKDLYEINQKFLINKTFFFGNLISIILILFFFKFIDYKFLFNIDKIIKIRFLNFKYVKILDNYTSIK